MSNDVLVSLRNFYRHQVKLVSANDEIPKAVITNLFMSAYEDYHHNREMNEEVRWNRCRNDINDYLADKIGLERYVMSTYEKHVAGELIASPTAIFMTRLLEVTHAADMHRFGADVIRLLELGWKTPAPDYEPVQTGFALNQHLKPVVEPGKRRPSLSAAPSVLPVMVGKVTFLPPCAGPCDAESV